MCVCVEGGGGGGRPHSCAHRSGRLENAPDTGAGGGGRRAGGRGGRGHRQRSPSISGCRCHRAATAPPPPSLGENFRPTPAPLARCARRGPPRLRAPAARPGVASPSVAGGLDLPTLDGMMPEIAGIMEIAAHIGCNPWSSPRRARHQLARQSTSKSPGGTRARQFPSPLPRAAAPRVARHCPRRPARAAHRAASARADPGAAASGRAAPTTLLRRGAVHRATVLLPPCQPPGLGPAPASGPRVARAPRRGRADTRAAPGRAGPRARAV